MKRKSIIKTEYFSAARLLIAAAAGFIICAYAGAAFAYEFGDMKLSGTLNYDGGIGKYDSMSRDPLTLSLYRSLFSNDNQRIDARLDFEHMHDINARQVFDFKNKFRGVSNTPQNLDFRNISNIYNITNMQYAVSHNKQSVSAVFMESLITKFSHARLSDLSSDSITGGYIFDHKTSDNTFYTLKFENSINKYQTHSADDFAYSGTSFKILHKMPKISRAPSYFSAYIFHDEPIIDDPEFVHFMDLTYELKASYGNKRMAYNPAGAFNDFKIDYSLHLDMSKVSKININGFIDRRAYVNEAVAGYFLNYDRSRLNFLYSHDLTPKCAFTPYIDFVKTNYLNLSGFNMTEIGIGSYLSLKYSGDIYWNLDFKRTSYMPFESRVGYPQQAKINVISSWIKYLSAKNRLVLDSDFELMRIGANESVYFAGYSMLSGELRYEHKLKEDYYIRTGAGGRVKKHPAFPVVDVYEIYGLIGLSVIF
ncbi:MAG TPA: hypothetical protein PKL57_04530 [Candidatus Wallbacteria bacterium]|nr:hypothetical protein [Candidatus Wallbacteria bacterium]